MRTTGVDWWKLDVYMLTMSEVNLDYSLLLKENDLFCMTC